MDKITNNILNNIQKPDVKSTNSSANDLSTAKTSGKKVFSTNVIDINSTKKMVTEMAASAPIDVDKVAKIKEAISSGKYPLDMDKLSDALMQAYREMKS